MIDLIDREAILKDIEKIRQSVQMMDDTHRASITMNGVWLCEKAVRNQPSEQPEQRYTEEELRVFAHGISLSLLSKRSAQHWRYDKDTATEIEFLERLYEKVGADMRGEQDDKCRQV